VLTARFLPCIVLYMSKITAEAATSLLAIFAGQTVTHDDVLAQITFEYQMASKRTGFSSYFKVTDAIEAAGVTSRYTGPNYTGDKLYTFPAN